MNTSSVSPLLDLFPELWGEVRSFLDYFDRLSLKQTCKRLEKLDPECLYSAVLPKISRKWREVAWCKKLALIALRENLQSLPTFTNCWFLGGLFHDYLRFEWIFVSNDPRNYKCTLLEIVLADDNSENWSFRSSPSFHCDIYGGGHNTWQELQKATPNIGIPPEGYYLEQGN
jgi:hypothetical protein